METTPEYHVITSGGLRPLEARRVNAISLKVARGPLRAISRLDSAWSDIFFFSLVEQARKLRSCENLPLPSSFSLSRVSRFFFVHRNLRRRTFSSCSPLAWRNRMCYIASRNYQYLLLCRSPLKEEEMETSRVRRKEQQDDDDVGKAIPK